MQNPLPATSSNVIETVPQTMIVAKKLAMRKRTQIKTLTKAKIMFLSSSKTTTLNVTPLL